MVLQGDEGGTEAAEGVQVFFARAPAGVSDEKMSEIFSTYGEVQWLVRI